jgi:hypothetical protein
LGPGSPDAWGDAITNIALDDTTGSEDFVDTTATNFAAATSVVVPGDGTITSGKLRMTVEYMRPAPVSGA